MPLIKPHSKFIRLFFFWSGIIATLAYRIIIVLNFYSPIGVQIAWYIGTVGFIIYFWHRYDIQKKTANLVRENKLVELIEKTDCHSKEQKEALYYIVNTALTSKAQWNSAFICWLSVLTLIVGIVMDLM